MNCEFCEIARKKIKAEIVYEDEVVVALVKDLAVFPGQIIIFPKEHYTILELVPDSIIHRLFTVANQLSMALFESLGVQGTNLIVENGTAAGQKVPHFSINVIPRKEGDQLNLQWKTKQLLEEEMDTAYLILKEEGDKLVIAKEKKKEEIIIQGNKTKIVVEKEGENNYLLKQLRRVP